MHPNTVVCGTIKSPTYLRNSCSSILPSLLVTISYDPICCYFDKPKFSRTYCMSLNNDCVLSFLFSSDYAKLFTWKCGGTSHHSLCYHQWMYRCNHSCLLLWHHYQHDYHKSSILACTICQHLTSIDIMIQSIWPWEGKPIHQLHHPHH